MTNTQTNIDSQLAAVIASIESSNNPHALRFEPTVFANFKTTSKPIVDVIAACNECSHDTALALASFSFGKYQLMGYNLYECGYRMGVVDFLNNETAQLGYFEAFLIRKGLNVSLSSLLASEQRLEQFAFIYNGSTLYAKAMRAVAQKMGFV